MTVEVRDLADDGRKFTRTGARQRTRFVMVPRWIGPALARNRRATGLALYVAVAAYADADDGTAWPSRARLAADIGKSEDTVDRAIAALVEVGAIERLGQRVRGSGHWSTARYRVHFDPPE